MPAKQRGSLEKLPSGRWSAVYRDEHGSRKRQGGFDTKTAAADWLKGKVNEVAALRRGDTAALRRRSMPTLDALCDEYLDQHLAEENTLRTYREWLAASRKQFGDLRIDRLDATEIGRWRKTLPPRSAWHYHKALRQVLAYAVRVGLLDRNVAADVPNPRPKRREVVVFDTPAQVEAIGEELWSEKTPSYLALPTVVAWTGLRPEEWIALERRDREGNKLFVRRVYTDGQIKTYGKTNRSLRAVPLPAPAVRALDAIPPRLDTQLLFPAERGGYINLDSFRRNLWKPALRAAGLEYRTPYALRHTYATWGIAAGIGLYELARFMGTSVEQIDRTYGHLLPDTLDRARDKLAAFLATPDDRDP
jgi:integrase